LTYTTHADLGGRPSSAPINNEPEEVRFHVEWEARALAVTLAMGATGNWNLDMGRAARESLPDYAVLSYYQIWIAALETLLLERSLISRDELSSGHALTPPLPIPPRLTAGEVPTALAKGSPTQRPITRPARFSVGDAVRTRSRHVEHHTRLPGYAAGRIGRIEHAHGMHVFADAHAQGLGESPQWLYTVVFDGRELWGNETAEGLSVSVDAWEPYLGPA
jgi:nitrile hydratase beta subunit